MILLIMSPSLVVFRTIAPHPVGPAQPSSRISANVRCASPWPQSSPHSTPSNRDTHPSPAHTSHSTPRPALSRSDPDTPDYRESDTPAPYATRCYHPRPPE